MIYTIKKVIYKILFNNLISNFFIRQLHLEKIVYRHSNPYLFFKTADSKSTQENAGYSNRPEINEVLEKSKQDLKLSVSLYCSTGDHLLDIGCGPGMYLSLWKDKGYDLTATDINETMIAEAKKHVPEAKFLTGDFMTLSFPEKFKLMYCIGVLIYIPYTDIKKFFQKIYDHLEDDGILYLNYPHAISLQDALYHDLTYIQYSPKAIEKWISPYFEIIKHEQAFDGRKIGMYDKTPYKSLNPHTDRTYKNSYLLIAKKKS